MTISCNPKVPMKNRPAGFIGELTRRLKAKIADETPWRTGKLAGGWRARGRKSGVIDLWNDIDYGEHVNARGKHRNFASCAHLQRLATSLAKDVQDDLE